MLATQEKMRTQSRFNMMRMGQPTSKDRKQVQNASHKIWHVVHRVLIPLLSSPMSTLVSFRPICVNDQGRQLLEFLRAHDPASVRDKASFISKMSSVYDAVAHAKQA